MDGHQVGLAKNLDDHALRRLLQGAQRGGLELDVGKSEISGDLADLAQFLIRIIKRFMHLKDNQPASGRSA